jgi:hypothetical protein
VKAPFRLVPADCFTDWKFGDPADRDPDLKAALLRLLRGDPALAREIAAALRLHDRNTGVPK